MTISVGFKNELYKSKCFKMTLLFFELISGENARITTQKL